MNKDLLVVMLAMTLSKYGMYFYNLLESKKKPNSDPTNTFAKRNVCKKTAKAYLVEGTIWLTMTILFLIIKRS